MTVANQIIKILEEENVQYIFGVPGEENEDILMALKDSSIQFVPTRHEQGAAFIANVIGRLTQKAGYCLSTLGPGATNLITGVADAQLDAAPVVAITAQGGTDRLHHESHQLIDVKKLYEPITKWNASIQNINTVSEIVRKAVNLAEQEKPGVTHIELPEDIASKKVNNINSYTPSKPASALTLADATIRDVHAMINEAQKPLVLAGNGVIRSGASDLLISFCEKHTIPLVNTFMAKGVMPHDHPLYVGTLGLGFKDYVYQAVEQADLILTVGYDVVEYEPNKWNIDKKKIIHINALSPEVYEEYTLSKSLVGNVGTIIESLKSDKISYTKTAWHTTINKQIESSIESYEPKDDDTAMNVAGALHIIRDILPHDGILISDVGSHKMWIARNYKTYKPNTCIISNGMASMGIALPGLIGANFAADNKHIIAVMGDGGALMNIQELETAVRTGCKGVFIVFKDNEYGLIEWKQEMDGHTPTGTSLGNPDFVQLAKSFGIDAHAIVDYDDLEKTLSKCIRENSLSLLEIPISNTINSDLVSTLEAYFQEKSASS